MFALIAAAAAAPQYAAPAFVAPAPAYGPAPIAVAAPVYPDVAPAYDYSYGVADSLSGANFGASEARNGYATQGEYHVNLPDGRLQTVTYSSDPATGYIADVKYSGEPVYAAPAPAYGAAPLRVAAPLPIAAPAFAPAPLRVAAPAFAPAFAPAPLAFRGPALLG